MKHRNALATIRQLSGRRYPELEKQLELMDERQLADLVRLLNDVRDGENRRCRGQASRMGLPGILR